MTEKLFYEESINIQNVYRSVQFSSVDKCLFGKVEGIDDLITYEGSTVKELEKAFHEMVDCHLVDSGE